MLWNARNGGVALAQSEMSYACFGRGPHTLILLPGLSDGLSTVKGKALLLAKPYAAFLDDFTVYLFSRRDDLPEGFTICDMANDQAAAIERLGLQGATVVGVSQGGMIAQSLAIDHPDLIGRLVIAVSAPSANDSVRTCLSRWIEMAWRGDHKALMIDTAEMSYSPQRLRAYRRIYPVLGAVGKPKDYRRFLVNAQAILGFDVREKLARITCPTLVIGAEKDKIVGVAASHEMNGRIRSSELFVYPGLGHGAYEEAKDFYARVFDFCGREDPERDGRRL